MLPSVLGTAYGMALLLAICEQGITVYIFTYWVCSVCTNAHIHASCLPLRSRPVLGKQVSYPSSLCGEPVGPAGCLALGLCAAGSTSYAYEVYACTVYSWSTERKPRQQRQTWFWDDSEMISDPLAHFCASWGYTGNPGRNPGCS